MQRREKLIVLATAAILIAVYLGAYQLASRFRYWQQGTRTLIVRTVARPWAEVLFWPLARLEQGLWEARGCEFSFHQRSDPGTPPPPAPATAGDQPP